MSASISSNEKVIFECDRHAENILSKLQKFYKDNDFFDTVLIAGEDSINIPAHQTVLSALSDYFWEIFHANPSNSNVNEVKLQGIEASVLKLIIDYMYSGTIELSSDNVEKLLLGAEFLKMENLLHGCCDFLEKHLNKSNCLHSLRLANKLRLSGLQEKSATIIYNDFEEVRKQPEFLLLNEMELKNLLFKDNPREDIEEQVFLGLAAWIEHEKIIRAHLLFGLLSLVRFQLLTPKFIIENTISVSNSVENCQLIQGWLQYHISPVSRTIKQQNVTFTSEVRLNDEEEEKEEEKEEREAHNEVIAAIGLNDRKGLEIYCYDDKLKTWIIKIMCNTLVNSNFQFFLKNQRILSKIVIDEKLFLVGGSMFAITSVAYIDLRTFKLTELPPMLSAKSNCQLANLNGHLCVFSGTSLGILNISKRQWIMLESPFKIDSSQQKIYAHKGFLYIFDYRHGLLNTYYPSSEQWTSQRAPLNDDVIGFEISVVGNFMYAICRPKYSEGLTVIKCLDILTSKDNWSEEFRFNYKNSDLFIAATVINNNIWIKFSNGEVLVYNPSTKKITAKGALRSDDFLILPYKL